MDKELIGSLWERARQEAQPRALREGAGVRSLAPGLYFEKYVRERFAALIAEECTKVCDGRRSAAQREDCAAYPHQVQHVAAGLAQARDCRSDEAEQDPAMPDPRNIRSGHDRARINANQDHELRYWAKKFA